MVQKISIHIGKGKQCHLSSACPKVQQEQVGRDTTEPSKTDIHSPVTHPEGKFPSKKSEDISILLAASHPFKRETNLCKNCKGTFPFILQIYFMDSLAFTIRPFKNLKYVT